MKNPKLEDAPALLSDAAAERFIEETDLTRYDLSGGTSLAAFEFQTKSASVHMRMPQKQLDQIKAEAARRGVPYQRFMRELMQRGLNTISHS